LVDYGSLIDLIDMTGLKDMTGLIDLIDKTLIRLISRLDRLD
jgi:chorismate mutase